MVASDHTSDHELTHANTARLAVDPQEIEGLSDSIVISPTFHLESALRGPMHTRSARKLERHESSERRSRGPPLLDMSLQRIHSHLVTIGRLMPASGAVAIDSFWDCFDDEWVGVSTLDDIPSRA